MIRLKILNKDEKREIEKQLEKQFGIKKIDGIILRKGKERLFLFSGNLSEQEIKKLEEIVIIERVGFYFAKIIKEDIKLSLDGTQILKDQINKNIIEVNEREMREWMSGQNLQITTGIHDFVIIKYKDDFLGCGKASESKIGNSIPKNRRIEKK